MGRIAGLLFCLAFMGTNAHASLTRLYFRMDGTSRYLSSDAPIEAGTCGSPGTGCDRIGSNDDGSVCTGGVRQTPSDPIYEYRYIVPEAWGVDIGGASDTGFNYWAANDISNVDANYTQPTIQVTYFYNDSLAGYPTRVETMGPACPCGNNYGGCPLDTPGMAAVNFIKDDGGNISPVNAYTTGTLRSSLPAGSTVLVQVWVAEGDDTASFISSAANPSFINVPYSKENFAMYGGILPQHSLISTTQTLIYTMYNTHTAAPSIERLEITVPGNILATGEFYGNLQVQSVSWGGATWSVTQAGASSDGQIGISFPTPVDPFEEVDIVFTVSIPGQRLVDFKRWSALATTDTKAVFDVTENSQDSLYTVSLDLPGAPTGLTALPQNTQSGGGQLQVGWTGPSLAQTHAVTAYYVYRGTYVAATKRPPGTSVSTWTPQTNIFTVLSQNVTESGLTNGQCYCYQVRSINPVGQSGLSTEICGTPYASPGVPGALSAAAGSQQVHLSWTPSPNGTYPLTGYQIYRCTFSGCSPSLYMTIWDTLPPTFGGTSYIDTGLTNGAVYSYQVRGFDTQGHYGNLSAVAYGRPPANPPSALAVTDCNSSYVGLAMSWSPPAGNIYPTTAYRLYRSTCAACSFSQYVSWISSAQNSYTDTGVTVGKPYRYTISALTEEGAPAFTEGPVSNETSCLTAPFAPAGLTILPGADKDLSLEWSGNNPPGAVSGYRIYRNTYSVAGIPSYLASTWTQAATAYLDSYTSYGRRYYYRVLAHQQVETWPDVDSPQTPEVWALTRPGPLTGLATQSGQVVRLSWQDLRPGQEIESYHVYRLEGAPTGATTLVASVSVTYYDDSAVTEGTLYYYQVRAYNWGGEGAAAVSNGVVPYRPPGPPGWLTAAPVPGQSSIQLSWAAATPALFPISGYEIFRGTSPAGAVFHAFLSGQSSVSYTDTGVFDGLIYYYHLRTVDVYGNASTITNVAPAAVTIPPCPPSSLTAAAVPGQVSLAWSPVTSTALCGAPVTFAVSGYRVYRSTYSGGGYTALDRVQDATASVYLDAAVTNGITYYYAVRSYDPPLNESVQYVSPFAPEYSPIQSATPRVPAAAVTALTILATAEHDGMLKLCWTAAAPATLPVIGYNIYRSTAVGGTETKAYVSGGATCSYLDTGLTNLRFYYYRVASVEERWFEGNWASISGTPYADPPAPGGMRLVAEGDEQIAIAWNPASMTSYPISGYQVYRATYAGLVNLEPDRRVGAAPLFATQFTDTGLTNGRIYYYHVGTYDDRLHLTAAADLSVQVSGTPFAPPGAPPNLTLNAGNNLVTVSWEAAPAGTYPAAAYVVYRGTYPNLGCPGPWTATVTGGLLQYFDNTAVNDTGYYYTVAAYDSVSSAHLSPCSGTAYAMPNASAESPPGAPTNPEARGISGQVDLNWGAATVTTYPISGYSIYRTTYAGSSAAPGELLMDLTTGGSVTYYADASVVDGTVYYYRVRAEDQRAVTPLYSEPTAEVFAFPAQAPAGLSAAVDPPGSATIYLAWNPTSAAGPLAVTGYQIYRAYSAGGPYSLLTVTAADSYATAYWDMTGSPGLGAYYLIKALHEEGWTSPASVTVYEVPQGPPSQPVLAAAGGDGTVALNWTAATSSLTQVTSYNVYRDETSGFTPGPGNLLAYLEQATPPLSYDDAGVTNGTMVYYRVGALDIISQETLSAEVGALPLGTAQSLTGGGGEMRAFLTWTPSAYGTAGISGYVIYRRTLTQGEEVVGTAYGEAAAEYTDLGLVNGTVYYYRVRAVDSTAAPANYSAYSAEVQVTPATAAQAPVIYSIQAGAAQIALQWTVPSTSGNPLSGYYLYRSSGGIQSSLLATVGLGATAYTDLSLANGVAYYYQVAAFDNSVPPVSGALSNTAYEIPYLSPNPPTSVTVFAAGNGSLTLGWAAAVATTFPIQGYYVYRGTAPGAQSPTAVGSTSNTWFTDSSGLANGTSYYYVVRAYDTGNHLSGASGEVSGVPFAAPLTPSVLAAQAANDLALVSWAAPLPGTYPLSGYVVYRDTCPGGCLTLAGTVYTNRFSDTAAQNGVSTTYYVAAFDIQGNQSPQASVLAPPNSAALVNPPLDVAAVGGMNLVTLNWTPPPAGSGAGQVSGYRIYRAPCLTCAYSLVGTVYSASGTTFTDTGLATAISYGYIVRAFSAGGTESLDYSGWTAAVTGLPYQPPGAPGPVQADALMGAVRISWSAAVSGTPYSIRYYRVYRDLAGGAFAGPPIATLSASRLSYEDFAVSLGTAYQYRVQVEDYGGILSAARDSNVVTPLGLQDSAFLSRNSFAPKRGERLGILFTLARPATAKVQVFTLSGLKVLEFEESLAANTAGRVYEVTEDGISVASDNAFIGWSGRAADGRYVASGVYVIRIEAGDFNKTVKVIVLK